MIELKKLLLEAPAEQMDPILKEFITKWDEPIPRSIQVLETLDHCIHDSLGSDFVVFVLQSVYDTRCKDEGVTHEDNEKLAVWRTT